MKKRILAMIMVLCMCMAQSVMAAEFADVPENHWAHASISRLADQGIISGMGDGSYQPDGTLTRGQFIKLLTCGLGEFDANETYKPMFYDTYEEAWYTPYVSCGVAANILDTEEYLFYPESPMTRGDAAVWIVNGIGVEKDVTCPFRDITDSEQKKAVAIAQSMGIINGYEDGTFRPDKTLTRAEASALIIRTMENRPTFGKVRPDAKNEIVMKESLKVIAIGEENIITKADAKQKTLTFSNPSETVKKLQKGDVFYIPDNSQTSEGILKVTSVKTSGGNVIVSIGAPELKDVVESIDISAVVSPSVEDLEKNENVSDIRAAAKGDMTAVGGMKTDGKEEEGKKGKNSEINIDGNAEVSTEAEWKDGKLVWKVSAPGNAIASFNLKTDDYDAVSKKKKEGAYASLDMSMEILLDVVLSGENFDADLYARAEANSEIVGVAGFHASKKIQKSIELPAIEFTVSGPITVEVKPYLVATAGGAFEVKAIATLNNSIGCEWKDGTFTTWSDPEFHSELDANADGYMEIGPKMVADLGIRDFEFKAFGKEIEIDAPEILNFTADMGIGVNGTVEIEQKAGANNDGAYYEGHQNTPDANGVIHHCIFCVKGEIYSYDQFSFGLSDDLNDFVEGLVDKRLTHTSEKITFPFSPWYHSRGAWGKETELARCPHKLVRVSGQITEKDTGEIISGASVKAVSKSAYIDFDKTVLAEDKSEIADGSGYYEMFLEPGNWEITVSEKAHKAIKPTITVPDNKEIKRDFVLELKDVEISGQITDKKTGKPVSGAEVVIGEKSVVSDVNGYYKLEVEARKTHNMEVTCTKYAEFITSLDVETEEIILNISLEPDDKWKEAYRPIIKREGKYMICKLIDFDHDDIPELIISGTPGSGGFSGFEKGYTYKNGEVLKLTAEEYMQVSYEYERYINNSTGEKRIEGGRSVRSGWAYSGGDGGFYSVSDGELVFTAVHGWSVETEQVGKNYIEHNKFYRHDGGNTTEISEGEYNHVKNSMHDGWTKDETLKQADIWCTYYAPDNSSVNDLYDAYDKSGK